jgi:hypothetical protein
VLVVRVLETLCLIEAVTLVEKDTKQIRNRADQKSGRCLK